MIMKVFDFFIHLLHTRFGIFDLLLGFLDILIIFLWVLFLRLLNGHTLRLCSNEVAQDVGAVSIAGTAILDRRNISNVRMMLLGLILLKRKRLFEFIFVLHRLELRLITLNLLFEIFNSLSHSLCYFKIVLNFLHGGTRLCLLQSIFR